MDVGDGVTHCVPVYEGFALPHAITRVDVAGRDVTEHLQLLMRRGGYNFHTTAEKEVVRCIKEDTCYVAFNPIKEEEQWKQQGHEESYKLPDGTDLQVGAERFRAPEILFHPEIIGLEYEGVQKSLVTSILKSDLDLRKTLFSQIVLAGGSTLFPGFGDRLLNEVRKLAPKEMKIRISAPPERKISTWVGG
jgi:centractin